MTCRPGYGSSASANTRGSYPECADPSQPGAGAIDAYLSTLSCQVMRNCQPGRYYLLNNYNAEPAAGAARAPVINDLQR